MESCLIYVSVLSVLGPSEWRVVCIPGSTFTLFQTDSSSVGIRSSFFFLNQLDHKFDSLLQAVKH